MFNFLHMHFNAFVEGVGGIEDEPIRGVEALENFESGAVVAADGERTQMRFVVGVDDDGAQSLGAEEKRVHGNLQARAGDFHAEMHLSVAAGKKLALMIWDIDFGEEGAGGLIDGFGGTDDFALKFLARILDQF